MHRLLRQYWYFLRATTVNHRQNFSPDEDEGFLEVACRRLQQLQNIREDAYATGALRQKVMPTLCLRHLLRYRRTASESLLLT